MAILGLLAKHDAFDGFELEITTDFNAVNTEALARAHSGAYIKFVNGLGKKLEVGYIMCSSAGAYRRTVGTLHYTKLWVHYTKFWVHYAKFWVHYTKCLGTLHQTLGTLRQSLGTLHYTIVHYTNVWAHYTIVHYSTLHQTLGTLHYTIVHTLHYLYTIVLLRLTCVSTDHKLSAVFYFLPNCT